MEHAIELRAALRGGAGPLLGFWATIPSPLTAEVAAMAGADYVVVDQQHGAVDPTAMVAMLQAIRLGGAAALVRVARNDPWIIGNALDLGALGVIVPMVETAEQAAEAVAACRYATQGVRSVGVLRGTSGSGALEPPLCLVMVETRAGLEAADAIAATPGLDGIYIGPSDLALSLGLQPTVTARARARARRDPARAGGLRGSGPAVRAALPRRPRRAALRPRRLRDAHHGRRPRLPAPGAGGRAHRRPRALTRRRRGQASGSTTSTARPPCGRGASATFPPCASATARTIDRPSPEPRPSRARPPRSNGSSEPPGGGRRDDGTAVDDVEHRAAASARVRHRDVPARARGGSRSRQVRGEPLEHAAVAAHPRGRDVEPHADPRRAAGGRGGRRQRGEVDAARGSAARPALREHQQAVEQRLHARGAQTTRPIARSSPRAASGSSSATSASVRITVSGVRSSWLALATKRALGLDGGAHARRARARRSPSRSAAPRASRRRGRAGTARRASASDGVGLIRRQRALRGGGRAATS